MQLLELFLGLVLGGIVGWLIQLVRIRHVAVAHTKMLNEMSRQADGEVAAVGKDLAVAQQALESAEQERKQLKFDIEQERKQSGKLQQDLSVALTENKNLEARLASQSDELEKIQEKFTVEFENLANKILRENSREFAATNHKNLDEVLTPLKEKIHLFEKKVEDTYTKGLRDQTDLRAELKKLHDLNQEISADAKNLTYALKGDVKKQGNWGEVVLERVLERSGLTQGQEFEREVVDENMEGKMIRPDVIINLPDRKHLIVDSKVSLIAYERLVNAENDSERTQHIKAHLLSLRTHIKTLSEKHYQSAKLLNTPDFVLLFVPIESSFSVAVQHDQELFSFAWEHKVVIVSPSTLLASLRTIASIWKQENQTRNAMEIARQSGALYDKLVSFLNDLDKIGKNLDVARDSYDKALAKLNSGRGNLVRTAEKIKVLGAKAQKQIPDKFILDENAEV